MQNEYKYKYFQSMLKCMKTVQINAFSAFICVQVCVLFIFRSLHKDLQKILMSNVFHSFRKHLDTMSPHLQTIKNPTPKGLATYMLLNLEKRKGTLI